MDFPVTRMRRYRRSPEIRDLFRETHLSLDDLICPVFVNEKLENGEIEEISTMPGEYRRSVDDTVVYAKELEAKGLKSIIIFGMPIEKDVLASQAYAFDGVVQRTVRKLKEETGLVVMTDVCLCQYTSHGHCGIVSGEEILNDESLEYLSQVALSHAQAGADVVAPSDMMDGRVAAIRQKLDENGFQNTIIMAYSAKFASAFYAPFREAVDSAPVFGDRKTYQMDPANAQEAIREAELDILEGADVIMVKPALAYLDIIRTLKTEFRMPLAAYNVSGEYSMLKAAIEKGYLTQDAIYESLLSIKRAGADLIITHFIDEIIQYL